MEAKILRSLDLAEAPRGIVWVAGRIWTVSDKSNSIKSQIENLDGKLCAGEEIEHGLENPVGIAWTGSEFILSDKEKKVIYKVDPRNKLQQLYLDPLKSTKNWFAPILQAKGSFISAIAFNQGDVWMTIQAGYSSSVLCFDGQTKEFVNAFFTRGPEPTGIAFKPSGEVGWVLEGSNKELSPFNTQTARVPGGNWTHTVLKVPLEDPYGLTIDDKANFLTIDREMKKIYVLCWER